MHYIAQTQFNRVPKYPSQDQGCDVQEFADRGQHVFSTTLWETVSTQELAKSLILQLVCSLPRNYHLQHGKTDVFWIRKKSFPPQSNAQFIRYNLGQWFILLWSISGRQNIRKLLFVFHSNTKWGPFCQSLYKQIVSSDWSS